MEKIPLFYWSEIKYIFREKENYGDLLAKYIVEKISGKSVIFVEPKKRPWYKRKKISYLSTGSIIHHASENSVVWGSGIIDHQQPVAKADFRAVRGPETRDHLLKLGYTCPPVFGDPAVLLPALFAPEPEKEFDLGIVPHYHDFDLAKQLFEGQPRVKVIDLLTSDVEVVTREILSCKKTISSSLHGLIVSHAYQIPSVWVEFSDKIFGNGIKYLDYLKSVDLPAYQPERISTGKILEKKSIFENFPSLPQIGKVEALQKQLWSSCPFIP